MSEDLNPKAADSGPVTADSPVNSGQQAEALAENDIVIYTMPKMFLTATKPGAKAKGIGLLILIGGAVVLIIGAGFLYFYITNSNLPFFNNQNESLNTSGPESSNQPSKPAETAESEKKGTAEAALDSKTGLSGQADGDGSAGGLSATTTPNPENKAVIETASSTQMPIETAITGSTSTQITAINPADSDSDGLFDDEEILLGTKNDARDSDSDGYEDLVELLRLYNPAGSGHLLANSSLEKYTNAKFGFTLYYPRAWPVEKVGGDESVIFKIGNNQLIQAITVEREPGKTISDWYKETTNTAFLDNGQILYKAGWEGVKSPDGLNIYLTKPALRYVLIMTYNLGAGNILAYKNIFQMMVNSLEMSN